MTRTNVDTLVERFTEIFDVIQIFLYHNYDEPIKDIYDTTEKEFSSTTRILTTQIISFNTTRFTDFNSIRLMIEQGYESRTLTCYLFRDGSCLDAEIAKTMSDADIMLAMHYLIRRHYPEQFQHIFNFAQNYFDSHSRSRYTFETFDKEQKTRAVRIGDLNKPALHFRLVYSNYAAEIYRIQVYDIKETCLEDLLLSECSQIEVSKAIGDLTARHSSKQPPPPPAFHAQMLEDIVDRCVHVLIYIH